MNSLWIIVKQTVLWSRMAHLGPISNSNFCVLLFIVAGFVVLAYVFQPRTKVGMRWLIAYLLLILLPAAMFVFCVGIIVVTGTTFA